MQQPPQMIPVMPSFPPTNITTEQIQKYLDENKKLILAILDNQNLGKLAECAQYQALLQKNLMYLAAIADAQPQGPVMPTAQMAPHPAMQQGGFYMQHPQAATMAQQPGIFPAKGPLQFNNPHQMQDKQQQQLQLQLQQQQAFQGQMGLRPGGPNNGLHPVHSETTLGGGSSSVPPSASAAAPSDVRAGSEQDAPETGTTGTDGRSSSTAGPGGGDGE
ncbi:GRF1-interacting factor 3 isoform X2 [Cornus florida]|nr:GRF1-interacting factor 3 isoform X2 [Cornus florida]